MKPFFSRSIEQFQTWLNDITCKRLAYETEDLLFLYILRTRHTVLWREALRRGCVIVAPRSTSLGAERCTSSAEAEAHILVPRWEVGGESVCEDAGSFVPLRGDARSDVSIVGSELVASGPVYQGGRRVRIVGIEDVRVCGNTEQGGGTLSQVFTSDVETFAVAVRVLRVSMPLVGGIPAPDEIDELDASHVVKCVALLRSAPEFEGTFREIDAFASDVALARAWCQWRLDASSGYWTQVADARPTDGLDAISPSLEAATFTMWRRGRDALLQGHAGHILGLDGATAALRVAQIVETYLMRSLHSVVYPWLLRRCEKDEHRFLNALRQARCGRGRNISLPKYACDLDNETHKAANALRLSTSPLDKLLCMKRVTLALTRDVDRTYRRRLLQRHPDSSVPAIPELATDDACRPCSLDEHS